MAYLGSGMEEVEKTVATCNMVCDTMTGNGSLTTMTIGASQEMPGHVNNVSIYFDGVAQRPATDYTLAGKTVTFTTAPENGVKVVCLSYASEYLDVISDATVYGSEILDGAITDAKIASGISASKLTGALPALDGSAVTNFSARGVVKNANDPVVTTNPANGLGTVWANTTSGEMYVCTDATANANVWTNVGPGTGNVDWNGWGTQYGYITGGHGPSGDQNQIGKHSFTSDSNATDVGDLTAANHANCGSQDLTHGYIVGGLSGGPCTNVVQRITFANASNSSNVGTLTVARAIGGGASSRTHGYIAGGDNNSTSPSNSGINVIEKFAFSASTTGSDIGDLSANKSSASGVMSQTHGYIRGGRISSTYNNVIERWPFASDTNSSDVGDCITAGGNFGFNGQNSKTHGYCAGGDGTGNSTRLQKHAFSASANATGVGTLAVATTPGAGTSSTTNGYTSGSGDSAPATNNIQKFSFSSDGNASNIADLTVNRGNAGGLSN